MGTFLSYSTSDPTTGQTPLPVNGVTTIGPFQTDNYAKIVGSVFADQVGSVSIQQSMDLSYQIGVDSGVGEYGNVFWDIVDTIAITGGTPVTIDIDVIGPVCQVVYTNGGTAQGALRIFLRAMGNRAAS
jgi:hypothetical protein